MAGGILAFTNAQKSSRDARRRADIDAFGKANELYYNDNTFLYAATSSSLTAFFPSGAVPVDPQGSAYTYSVNAGRTSYCICALLEQTNKGRNTSAGAAGVCAYGTGNYYCADNRQ